MAYLETRNLVKKYPGVKALDNVSLSLDEGEVHALIGENGAGKSTLIKILSGATTPDSGEILFKGVSYKGLTAQQAMEMGISTIYQEFNLVPGLSIAENVFLGREKASGPFINFNAMCRATEDLFQEMHLNINPRLPVNRIGVAYQQVVEIIKAVSINSKFLIMDEPTAPLTNSETKSLFQMIKTLKSKGVTILYISHRLEEIFEVCDRVSVMRDGRYIKTFVTGETSKHELIHLMVGHELADNYSKASFNVNSEPYLVVNNLNTAKLRNVSFHVSRGEVVGFGGLVGAGRTETMRSIFGADPVKTCEIKINGKNVRIKNPAEAIENGIVLIPEDRKNQGLILGMNIKSNITIGSINTMCRFSFVNQKKENSICEDFKNELQIKTPSLLQKVQNLSGGNQQKVVLAKWLAIDCEVFLFDEPTRGIDVGAKREIYNLIIALASRGKCIIIVSSEMPELISMSDRIYVMYEGNIAGVLRKDEVTQEAILSLASGQALSDKKNVTIQSLAEDSELRRNERAFSPERL